MVYVLLTVLYLVPIWTFATFTVTRSPPPHYNRGRVDLLMCRIAKDANTSKSKSLLLLPALPALLAALSGLGLVVPSSGVFVEVRRQLFIY